jgi:hypothetical protein
MMNQQGTVDVAVAHLKASMHCSKVVSCCSTSNVSSMKFSSRCDCASQFMHLVCVTVFPQKMSCTKVLCSELSVGRWMPALLPCDGWADPSPTCDVLTLKLVSVLLRESCAASAETPFRRGAWTCSVFAGPSSCA